jgi:enamine deaminase RidA (YjgF/YER057c/UK114 family)
MLRRFDVDTIALPRAHYSHGVEVPANARWLVPAGAVPIAPDGSIPLGIEAQAERCWLNVLAVLASARMTLADVVKVTIYLTRKEDMPGFRKVRDRILGEHRPASTLLVVSGLANPEYLVEIDVVAAKA